MAVKQDNFIRNALFIGLGSWLLLKNVVPMFKGQQLPQLPAGDAGTDNLIPPVQMPHEEVFPVPYYPEEPYLPPPENDGNDGNNNDEGKMQIEPPLPLPELGPPSGDPPSPLPIKPPIPTPIIKKTRTASVKGIFMDMLDEFELGDRTWFYSSQDMIDSEKPFPQRKLHASSCCTFIPTRKKSAEAPTEKIYY